MKVKSASNGQVCFCVSLIFKNVPECNALFPLATIDVRFVVFLVPKLLVQLIKNYTEINMGIIFKILYSFWV